MRKLIARLILVLFTALLIFLLLFFIVGGIVMVVFALTSHLGWIFGSLISLGIIGFWPLLLWAISVSEEKD